MPDPITPVATPEPVATPTPTPVELANPLPPVPPVPGDPLGRERYEKMYGTPTPTPSAPVPPSQPSEPGRAPANLSSEEVIQLLTSLKADLDDLRNTRVSPPQPSQPSSPANPPKKWTELVQAGLIDEADAFLQKQTVDAAVPLAVAQAIREMETRQSVEKQINEFNANILKDAPEVEVLGDVIADRVEKELLDMQSKGLVTDVAAYVEAYKKLTSKHVENAKQYVLKIRALGKQEATAARTEVLVSGSPVPSSARIDPGTSPTKETPLTPRDVIIARQQENLRRQGLR